jgi:hypothetical protein
LKSEVRWKSFPDVSFPQTYSSIQNFSPEKKSVKAMNISSEIDFSATRNVPSCQITERGLDTNSR